MSASDKFYQYEGADRPSITDYLEHGHTGGTDDGLPYKSTLDVPQVVNIDEASATVTYFGYAKVGTTTSASSWRIKRLTVSGTTTTTEWADGDAKWDNIWDNRASLSYS